MVLKVGLDLEEHYRRFKGLTRRIKQVLIGDDGNGGWYVQLANQGTTSSELVRVIKLLHETLSGMTEIGAVPGIVAYIRTVEDDPDYDVVADYQAMRTTLEALQTGIYNGVPKTSQGGVDWWLITAIAIDGTEIERTFTPAQTASLRTIIDQFRVTVL